MPRTELRPADPCDQIADRLIRQIDRLHSAPHVAQRILRLTSGQDYDLAEVVECLEQDPALTAQLLRVVNSSRYGLRNRIVSVRYAASYLGRNSLRLITLGFSLVKTLTRGVQGQLYRNYWRRALAMAAAAGQLAQRRKGISRDEAYTAGLLADVGVLAFAQSDPRGYAELTECLPHDRELLQAELDAYGVAHPALGARLLEGWEAPEQLVAAVRGHHQLTPDAQPLELLVAASDLVADALLTPQSRQVLAAKELLHAEFGLDTDGFIELALACRDEVKDSAASFALPDDHAINCDELIDQSRRLSTEACLEMALEMDSLENTLNDLSL